jgi:coenzyme F420-dependent glucose-6-phosphate dehydrogenase
MFIWIRMAVQGPFALYVFGASKSFLSNWGDSNGWIFMLRLGYAAQHEEYQPGQLLDFAVEAERSGFDSIWTSDHFHPWAHTNAAGGFAWVWMAAAAERTKRVEIGTGVTCPTLRYNPAVVAQAFATLRTMYPDRIFLGLGAGEALNESPVGCQWPPFKERAARLEEALTIIKRLWSESFVDFKGKHYTLRKANLYTKPRTPPPIYLAAAGPTVAEMAGKMADGLVTVMWESRLKDVVLPALARGARAAGRDPNDIIKAVEVGVSYDEDYDKALAKARFWAGDYLPVMFKYDIFDPREIESNGSLVGDEQIAQLRMIGTKPEDHIRCLEKYIKMGFQHIYIQSSSPDEIRTLRMYSKEVLPYIRSTYQNK